MEISLGDSLAGTFGALTALYHRNTQQGVTGQVADIGIYKAVFKMMESRIPDYKPLGLVRERTGSVLPGVSPSNIYPNRDEKYVVIAAHADAVFARLTRAMGQPELSVAPPFSTHEARGDQMEELDGIISDWSRGYLPDPSIRQQRLLTILTTGPGKCSLTSPIPLSARW